MAPSELSKAANRIAFGEQEQEVGFSNGTYVGLGLIGGSTGKIRAAKTSQFKGFLTLKQHRFPKNTKK
jgi:hypothetical protein